MTDEERESLQLIAYRLSLLEQGMQEVREDTKQVGQILGKLRLDEEVLRGLQTQTNKLEHNQRVTDEKQDSRIKELEDIVVPSHGYWTATADTQRSLLIKVAVAVIGGLGSMGGLLAYFR